MSNNLLTKTKNFFLGIKTKASTGFNYISNSIFTWIDDFEFAKYNPLKGQSMYETNELVSACMKFISESVAGSTMRIYEDDEEVTDHPARQMMYSPNSLMSEFEFWEFIILQLYIDGNSFVQKIRNNAGEVVQLWPLLYPSWMEPFLDDDGQVPYYRYNSIKGGIIVKADDIIHFKMPRYNNPYYGKAPLAHAVQAADRDSETTNFTYHLMKNGAVPQGILSTTQRLEKYETDRIKATWKANYSGDGRNDISVLDMDTKYEKMGLSPSEMSIPDINSLNESRICMILGIPPVLISALIGLENSTYNNVSTLRVLVWENTLNPLYIRLNDKLNKSLAADFGFIPSATPFRWDFSKVLALRELRKATRDEAREDFKVGGITRAELRAIIGQPVSKSDHVYMVNQSLIPVQQNQAPIVPTDEIETVADETAKDETLEDETLEDNETKAWPIEGQLYFKKQMKLLRANNVKAESNGHHKHQLA